MLQLTTSTNRSQVATQSGGWQRPISARRPEQPPPTKSFHPFTHAQPSHPLGKIHRSFHLTMSTCKSAVRICTNARQPFQPSLLPRTQCRHESTTRRHKKLLTVQQAPSYTPDRPEPTLIFNPPSSAPSPYHTPLKFLPQSDKRRALYASFLSTSTQRAHRTATSPVSSPGTPLSTSSLLPPKPSASLPPALRQPYEKKYHLTDVEIREIQRLRAEDPVRWTRVRLAEKFGCSQFFVGLVAKNEAKAEQVGREHDKARNKWGERRREARHERQRRKELWGRDM